MATTTSSQKAKWIFCESYIYDVYFMDMNTFYVPPVYKMNK